MKRQWVWWPMLATVLVLLEAFWLQGFHPAMPSLLVPAVLYTVHIRQWKGLVLALWLGLVLDLAAVGPFGVYMLVSTGMLVLARVLQIRGLELRHGLNLLLLSAALLGWQYAVMAVIGLISGSYAPILLPFIVVMLGMQLVLTAAVSFVLLRILRI